MKDEKDDDVIEITDKEKESGIRDELNEAAEEIGGFFKKVGDKIAKKSNEISQTFKHNRERNTLLRETLKIFSIAGLDSEIKVFGGDENENAIYIRQDDRNLDKILKGSILIDEDDKKLLITKIDKDSISQKKLMVDGKEELFPCFRAEYEIYEVAKPKIDKIEYKD